MHRRAKSALPARAKTDNENNPLRLAEALGLEFINWELLRVALTHRSVAHELRNAAPELELPPSRRSNERLEFLGDSVLGYVVASDLYDRFPEATEGDLTSRRVTLVRTERLVAWARSINLGDYVYMATGERITGSSRDRILSGAFEAIVGAITLDRGVAAAGEFVQRFLDADVADSLEAGIAANPKGQLQEYVQEHYRQAPIYRIIDAEGPDHARVFTAEVMVGDSALGAGAGESKRAAEQAAAAAALERLAPQFPLRSSRSIRKRRKSRTPKGGAAHDG